MRPVVQMENLLCAPSGSHHHHASGSGISHRSHVRRPPPPRAPQGAATVVFSRGTPTTTRTSRSYRCHAPGWRCRSCIGRGHKKLNPSGLGLFYRHSRPGAAEPDGSIESELPLAIGVAHFLVFSTCLCRDLLITNRVVHALNDKWH